MKRAKTHELLWETRLDDNKSCCHSDEYNAQGGDIMNSYVCTMLYTYIHLMYES